MRESYYRHWFRDPARFLGRDGAGGLCWHCGLKGAHASSADCIHALREQIANLEIEIVKLRSEKRSRRPKKDLIQR